MIGTIRGIILEKHPPYLLLEAGNIGYEILVPMSTFYHLPDAQQEITLYTHLMIREDAHTLYGFYTERDRRLFRTLIKVNGLGPKSALSILSSIEPEQFIQYVANQDTEQLMHIPGIGRKTAERLLIETRDAFANWNIDKKSQGDSPHKQDAIHALLALGYKAKEAKETVHAIYHPSLNLEDLIRAALKYEHS